MERARLIIERCAHPNYRPILREYLGEVVDGHTPQTLRNAFCLHEAFLRDGDMSKATLI
jgi:acyl-CoA hydrolase